jgi:hypothetical protein
MPVSKPPETRSKPEGICRSTHLDVRAQGIPELRSQAYAGAIEGIRGHPPRQRIEVDIAGAWRLTDGVEPLNGSFILR